MKVPTPYLLNKFYSYSYEPSYRRHDGTYNAGCPVCKEGKSLGKKKRLFLYPESNTLHCFNCNKTWGALNWIKQVASLDYEEIEDELISGKFSVDVFERNPNYVEKTKKQLPDLPFDSINIFDSIQQKFYEKNYNFKTALNYIKARKLDVAINKSPNLFISLTDYIHKNRICIPFYDTSKNLVFYQSRSVGDVDPKYLGKRGYEKTVFGIDRVDLNIPYLFITEGPIDAMFIKNGISCAGLTLTNHQQTQFMDFPFHKKIWILDNPKFDQSAKDKITELIDMGETVFKWLDSMPYKDFNEMAMFENLIEIDYNNIINNLY